MAAAADSSPLLASSPTKCLWGEGGECGGEGKRKRDKYGKRRVCVCVCVEEEMCSYGFLLRTH